MFSITNFKRMEEIRIISDGKVLSNVYSGTGLAGIVKYLAGYRKVFIICDAAVVHYGSLIQDAAKAAGINVVDLQSVTISETDKSIYTVLGICEWLMGHNADRNDMLLSVGGGITTDMGGFAACIFKRGIHFAYVPTTLLSQVDAAIGGKTGVNFGDYKNMLGIIRQPDFTYECQEVLTTLPRRDFNSGAAEMLKTFIIEDNGWYEKAVTLLSSLNNATKRQDLLKSLKEEVQELIAAAASVKAGVVSRDQFESGERRKLNLGHTFAHAIESEAFKREMDITHGEAVAMGIIMAAQLSEKLGLAKDLSDRMTEEFIACGLPTAAPFALTDLAEAMGKDKKAEGEVVHFILPVRVGEVVEKDLRVEEVVELLKDVK